MTILWKLLWNAKTYRCGYGSPKFRGENFSRWLWDHETCECFNFSLKSSPLYGISFPAIYKVYVYIILWMSWYTYIRSDCLPNNCYICTEVTTMTPVLVSCATGAASCVADSTCNDIPGGFECMCNSGFEGDGTIECTGKVYRQCHVYTIRLKLKPVSFRSV